MKIQKDFSATKSSETQNKAQGDEYYSFFKC